MLLFADKIPKNRTAFEEKVISISQDLGINPNWLMLLMKHESGLNSQIQNSIGATGLIQFMPATAQGLGTSTSELASMNNVKQLDYVYKYFKPYSGKIKTYADLHLVAFFPLAIGKPDTFIFQANNLSASIIAQQNKIFDLNSDNKITAGEARTYFANFAKKMVPKEFVSQFENFTKSKTMKYLDLAVIIAIAIILGVSIYKLVKSW